MRLAAIRLAGFKSFVDRTQLQLNSNLTAVVGPNGCGKSNLIDAVRWVLGESSAKQLRGAQLADVIFNGSKTRKPVGRAMIELVFDNSEGKLTGAYADVAEISVRRELSRDGQSTFLINGTRCRRKDVTELFMGTGLGSRSNYAIIEQGTVSRLIEAQPEDLRQMLEESAGISRYKERRRETELRIRHTRENLERLDDLLSEINERLAKLQRQAAAARRFRNYKDEQRVLRRQLLGLRWQALDGDMSTARTAADSARTMLAEREETLKSAMVQRTRDTEVAEECAAAAQQAQAAYYEAEAQAGRRAQELKHATEMLRMREQEAQNLAAEIERLGKQRDERDGQMTSLAERSRALEGELQDKQQQLAAVDEQIADLEASAQAEAEAWREARQALEQPRTAAATESVRREQLERQLQRAAERVQRATEELVKLDTAPLQAELDQARQDLTAAATAEQQADQHAQAARQDVQQRRDQRQAADQAVHEARTAFQSTHARHAALSAEQERALSQDDAGLRKWLAEQGFDRAEPVARHLSVDDGWEVAVESVLGPWLQAPCVDVAVHEMEWPSSGDLRLVRGGGDAAELPASSLGARIRGVPAIAAMLANVHACDDGKVEAMLASLAPGSAVVTPDGVIHQRGAVHARVRGRDEQGVLLRQRLLEQLTNDVAQAQAGLEQASAAQQQALAALKQAEDEQQQAMQGLDKARRAHAELRGRTQGLTDRLEALAQRRAQREQDVTEAGALQESLSGELEAVTAALQGHTEQVMQLEGAEREAAAAAEKSRIAFADARRQQQEWRQAVERLRERHVALGNEFAAARAGVDSIAARTEHMQKTLAQLTDTLDDLRAPLPELQRQVDEAQAARETSQKALNEARARQQAAAQGVHGTQESLMRAEKLVNDAREAAQQAQYGVQRVEARREALQEQLRESHLRLEDVVRDLPDDLTVPDCEERLEQVDQKIQRLGAVNLAAVQEYEDENKRAEQLQAQTADLREALEKLEDAIRQIDRETRSRFKATFESVNERFKARFPRLFGGGEAYLELVGEDVLDAGVRVMARPPGKRNSSIQLLSGGEKALTAVSLVFALFELNPAPFCMLDEVDAPLDDANVVRFCDVVREMSEHVQFIIVSHNKVTMELADQLNGVTMQEAGVSRLVSVDVQQAVALAG